MPPADAADLRWRKSSYSNGGDTGECVEVADLPGGMAVRDSKLLDRSPILTFSHEGWGAIVEAVKSGRLDLP